MNVAVNENLELILPPGRESVILTPGEAFDLAEDLIRRGIRRAMVEETRMPPGFDQAVEGVKQ